MTASGARMFARYAYPPNALGYCGPDDAAVLLSRDTPDAEARIAKHAREFEGAWAYLELIAEAARIADPLDERVVEAYWVGNELLDRIDPAAMLAELRSRFVGQSDAGWTPGLPHHSFHVFTVYPWVNLLSRAANRDVALSVLDQCRIRWGDVLAVEGERVRVRSQPLVLVDGRLELGPAREQTAAWSADGQAVLSSVAVGDQVAMHWDWVCDVLDHRQLAELEARSADQLGATNAALSGSAR
ncbi:MAG: DUF6390 family protein [Actinomycetota bacterium]|nr:DUF6390 family protein [Actinomycetota bacterium]MDQ2847118.1 DUF6390 family protein [Actinomycetota bacterium]MDQ2955700.1 DUF6390 family protein [Actinomycetota bacterium]